MSDSKPMFTASPVGTTRLLPIYILCDTSFSMGQDDAIDKINDGLAGIVQQIVRQGDKGSDIRLCVISFATTAKIELSLTRVEFETVIPKLTASGVTNFPAAVELLTETLYKDYHAMRQQDERAYRPAVFILTDGRPTDHQGNQLTQPDAWLRPLEDLKNHNIWGPRIYAYGFGDAHPDQLRLMVADRGKPDPVVANRVKFSGGDLAESVGRLFPLLFSTVINLADALSDGASEEQITEAIDKVHEETTIELSDADPDDWWGIRQ